MRTLRITLLASLAGWGVGIVAGNIGGFALAWLEYGPLRTWRAMTVRDFIVSETTWVFMVAVGMLPGCALVVAPLAFHQLGKPSRWHPFLAFWVGGLGGLVAFFLWLAVLALFTTPINWSRPDDRMAAGLFTAAAFLIGATTGCVAALMARSHHGIASNPVPPGSVPPPVPFDY